MPPELPFERASLRPPENGMKPKFAPAQLECLERGALVTYVKEVIAGPAACQRWS